MIKTKVKKQFEKGNEIVYIEISNADPDYYFNWEPMLDKLSRLDLRTVFCIEELDSDGIDHTLFHYWLDKSKKLYIKTDSDDVKEVLKIMYEDKVVFV